MKGSKMKLIDNQTRKALEEMGARLTTMPGRYEAVHMAGEAGTVTFITEANASQEMQAAIVKRTVEVAKLAHQIAKVSSDANLSTEGKRNLRRSLDADRRKLAQRLEADAVQIEGISVLAKIGEQQLYEAPAIERGDFESVMHDREVRGYFETRSPEELGNALAAMTPRQLEALRRAPIPLTQPLNHLAEAAWEAHLQTDKAAEFQIVQNDLDNARFGVNAIGQLRQAVERLTFHDAAIRPHVEQEVA